MVALIRAAAIVVSLVALSLTVNAVEPDNKRGLESLIQTMGKPRNDAEAIAQNTILLMNLSNVCGYQNRARKYQAEQDRGIQNAMHEAYGNDLQAPERLATKIGSWWNNKSTLTVAKQELCEMMKRSLERMGY